MIAMIGNMIDGSRPGSLVIGLMLFVVPALMFTVWGIIDKRGVMFAVHAIFLAFWVFVILNNRDDFGTAFNEVLANPADLGTCLLAFVISFFVWFFVIRLFFRRKG